MEEVKTTGNRWAKPMGIAVIILTIVACILALGFAKTDLGAAAQDYEKNKTAAAQSGLYFASDEIRKLYAVPEEENGAELVQSTLPVIRKIKLEDPKKLTAESVEKHWAMLEPEIAKLEEASKRKYVIFQRDLANPIMILYPQFADFKSWVKYLSYSAKFAAEKGDASKARRCLDIAAFLANAADDEGILIGDLVRIACSAIIQVQLKEIVHKRGRQPEWQNVVEATLRRLDHPHDAKTFLKIEHWFATTGVELVMKDPKSFYSDMGGGSTPNELRFGRYLPRFKTANLSRIHEAYAGVMQKIPDDPYDLQATMRAYEGLDVYNSKQGMSYTMLGIVAPVFSQAITAMAKEVATRNALFQAVAMLKTGAKPENGLPMKGRYLMDIDGKNLRIKKASKGWIIYSVWGDKVDDGGQEFTNGKGDWVVHLPK